MTVQTIFNFFDIEETAAALCQHFDIDEKNFEDFLVREIGNSKENLESVYFKFITEFGIQLEIISTENVVVKAKHITTQPEGEKSIKKYGLLSLIDVIQKETPLKKFLDDCDIHIDLEKKRIFLSDKVIHLVSGDDHPSHVNQSLRYAEYVNRIYQTLYFDNGEIEFFLGGKDEDIFRYSTVTRHPEILEKLNSLSNELGLSLDLVNKWKLLQNDCFYVLEFIFPVGGLKYIKELLVENDEYDSSEAYFKLFSYTRSDYIVGSIPNEFYINLFLVKNSLDVVFTGKGKEFGQIATSVNIPYGDIVVTKVFI